MKKRQNTGKSEVEEKYDRYEKYILELAKEYDCYDEVLTAMNQEAGTKYENLEDLLKHHPII